MWKELKDGIQAHDVKALARAITLVENGYEGYENFLQSLPSSNKKIIGITGAPGAGKSTLVDALIEVMARAGKKIGVLCVDPSSPFNLGALLGDRIRMNEWYTHPQVYIRSLATRGSMGGLHPRIIEIAEIMKAFEFDEIIIETVGVGQSEIEIAGLADVTAVVLIPEGGDEIQTMKAGLMEIADVFVLNKADRPAADEYLKHLRMMLAPAFNNHQHELPILKTIATSKIGIEELYLTLQKQLSVDGDRDRHYWLLAERAYHIIRERKMEGIDKKALKDAIEKNFDKFNLFEFVDRTLHKLKEN